MDDYARRDGSVCAEADRPFVSGCSLQNDPHPVLSLLCLVSLMSACFVLQKQKRLPQNVGWGKIFTTESFKQKEKKGAARTRAGRVETKMQVKEGNVRWKQLMQEKMERARWRCSEERTP